MDTKPENTINKEEINLIKAALREMRALTGRRQIRIEILLGKLESASSVDLHYD